MRKPDFEKATKLATHLLLLQDLSERFLDVKTMRLDKNIVFTTYDEYAQLVGQDLPAYDKSNKNSPGNTGLYIERTVGKNTFFVIAYNDKEEIYERRNWTLAHEVGHVYMGHKTGKGIEEIEANYFAAQYFMPEYTLYKMRQEYGMFTAADLSEIFGVSIESAQKRIKTFNNKSLFDGSTESRLIWERQKPKIDLYFKCKKTGEDFRFALEIENWYNEQMRELLYH